MSVELPTLNKYKYNTIQYNTILRKKTGGLYQAGSYVSTRSPIQRHLTSLKRTFRNIDDSEEFVTSNRLLDVVLKP